MALRWNYRKPGSKKMKIVDGGTLRPPKPLMPESFGTAAVPQVFEVFELYGPAMRQIREWLGLPERRTVSSLRAVADAASGNYFADVPWALPEPRGPRRSAAFVFTADDAGEWSGVVRSCRLAKVDWDIHGDGGGAVPAGPASIDLHVGGTVKSRAKALRDPIVDVDLLTGSRLVDFMLESLAQDFEPTYDGEFSGDVLARLELGRQDLEARLRASYAAPEDWLVGLETVQLELGEGESAEIALSLELPSPGVGYFAVSYIDTETGEGDTSEVLALEVTEEGRLRAWTDVSALPLAEPAPYADA